jgi:hypothetical protein
MPALHRDNAVRALAGACLLALGLAACRRPEAGPRELLERYFATAVRQDYAETWECYDQSYRSKVARGEFVQRRREASRLQSWKMVSLEQQGDHARAGVELVFAPSPKLGRSEPARTTVVEELVREREGWRIKVW